MPATDWRPSPVRVLTSVDLPTPEDPTSATVCPGPHHGASAIRGVGVAGVEALDEQAGQEARRGGDIGMGVVDEIGLGQHDHRHHLGLAGEGQVAFEARNIEVAVAGRHDEERVDVGRDELDRRPVPAAFRLNRLFRARQTPRQVVRRIEEHEVADRRLVLVGLGMNGRYPPLETGRGDLEAVPMDRKDAGGKKRREVVLSELRGEVVRPAELGQPLKNIRHLISTIPCSA